MAAPRAQSLWSRTTVLRLTPNSRYTAAYALSSCSHTAQRHGGIKAMSSLTTHRGTRASFWRGGTSNGVLFDSKNVPGWSEIKEDQKNDLSVLQKVVNDFLAAVMGVPDPHMRELNGMGQGSSSTSKVMIVERSALPDVDIDYWFVQVGITSGRSDLSGNCGNLSSPDVVVDYMIGPGHLTFEIHRAVAPFALNNSLVANPEEKLDQTTVRTNEFGQRTGSMRINLRNRNTNKIITSNFVAVEDDHGWRFEEDGDFAIDGVSQTSTPITLDFHDPAGSQTSNGALPTGNPTDTLAVNGENIEATLTDVSNPAVLISGHVFGWDPSNPPEALTANVSLITKLELIRQAGATRMGLNPNNESTPAIVLLYSPSEANTEHDIVARAVCMKQAHKAVPMTFGMNVGASTKIPGTIPYRLVREESREKSVVRVGHPSGTVSFGAEMENGRIVTTKVVRTARPLMDGFVNHHRKARG